MKIVLFGDSLTFGYGVWPKDNIENLLKKHYKNIEFVNSGMNGDTTREAVIRFQKDVLIHNPDVVTFMFGSNDSAMGDGPYRTLFEYRANIELMIEKLKCKNKKCEMIFITPPPVDDFVFMPWTYNDRLEPYCETLRQIAQKHNAYLSDLNFHFNSLQNLPQYLQEDGCHLSEKGYAEFFECLKNTIDKVLETQK